MSELNFEAAETAALETIAPGEASGYLPAFRDHLNTQHRALLDAAVAQARREFAGECRTRLVATDPVGLTTGPLFDWLTKEMGE